MDQYVHIYPKPNGKIGTWRKHAGASAGQSPLIHTIDVALGINHIPVKTCPISGATGTNHIDNNEIILNSNPMEEMRESLPASFQEYIRDLAEAPSIRNYCLKQKNTLLAQEFNRACDMMKIFRDLHLQLVSHYIIAQRKGTDAAIGTGGTDLIPFLKQVRQETEDTKIY
jgi:indoleamine 2,3-dioxygenase